MTKKFLVFCLIILFTLTGCNKNKENNNNENIGNESFFISNKDKDKALFSCNGQQLTDFIFSSCYEFNDGYAYVFNKDGKGAVINSKGKYTIKPGEYEVVSKLGKMFTVRDNNKNKFLVSGNGKSKININDYIATSLASGNLVSLKKDDKITYINSYGKKVLTLNDVKEDPIIHSNDYHAIINHNNMTYVYDIVKAKMVTEFQSNKEYGINKSSDSLIILESDDKDFIVYKDNVLYDMTDDCSDVKHVYEYTFCKKKDEFDYYLVNDKFKPVVNVMNTLFIDDKNYAIKDKDSVKIFRNNKEVANLEGAFISSRKNIVNKTLYPIKYNFNSNVKEEYKNKYVYYDIDGKDIFNTSFKDANTYDKLNNALVSLDFKNYYLINTKGEKVSEDYDKIYFKDNAYIVKKDNKYGLLDKKGNEILDTVYKKIDVLGPVSKGLYKVTSEDNKVLIFNIFNNNSNFEVDGKVIYNYDGYIKVTNNNVNKYYTDNGKLIYSDDK